VPIRLYHVTTWKAAAAIQREGFRDGEGSYGLVDLMLRASGSRTSRST
jgi:hypothetical protein